MDVEHLSERSFIAQRIIHDHIESAEGLANVQISKQCHLLELNRRELESQEKYLKEATMDEIRVLKKKKWQFETDIEALLILTMNLLLALKIQEALLGLPNQTLCGDLPRKKGQP